MIAKIAGIAKSAKIERPDSTTEITEEHGGKKARHVPAGL